MTSSEELVLLATQNKALAEGCAKVICAKDAEIKALKERLARFEEAEAGVFKTKPITQEEWRENFK